MNILVTNDDGVHSKGIRALAEYLTYKGHTVTVVAPLAEHTAKGHGITLHRPLRLNLLEKKPALKIYSLDGSPSDCVKIAIQHLMRKNTPDWVVSGINHGSNLGFNVFYSGTVAAAIEGYFMGVHACAVSLPHYNKENLIFAAHVCENFIQRAKEKKLPRNVIMNINVPGGSPLKIKGEKVTHLGKSLFLKEKIKRFKNPHNAQCLWLTGEKMKLDTHFHAESDALAVEKGYISLTPLHVDLTDYCAAKNLKKVQWNLF
jgi:5'-nucleotidase